MRTYWIKVGGDLVQKKANYHVISLDGKLELNQRGKEGELSRLVALFNKWDYFEVEHD